MRTSSMRNSRMNTSEPKMSKTDSDKNIHRAHMLLASYWIYRVLRGQGIIKPTLNVLKMEAMSVRRERVDKLRKGGMKTAAKSAVKAGTAGLLIKRMQFKLVKRILKSARII